MIKCLEGEMEKLGLTELGSSRLMKDVREEMLKQLPKWLLTHGKSY